MLIHHAPDGVWTGQSREIGDRDPIPPGWIMAAAPPPVPEGKVAMWVDGWAITDRPEPPALTVEDICRQIDAERDRRIDGGFTFQGERLQSRPSDRENVMGAAQLAMGYLAAGGDPSSLRWADPDNDFVWITADNGTIALTAADTIAMFQAGVAFKSALTFYARAMKDAVIAAEDPSSVEWGEGWPE